MGSPQAYPQGEEGVVDLGHRHFVKPFAQAGWLGDSGGEEAPTAWLWWHDCPAVEHVSWGWFGARVDGSRSGHRVVSAEPLEVEGSLLCTDCGDHGFVRGGRWVPA